jgi:hypothetical protein
MRSHTMFIIMLALTIPMTAAKFKLAVHSPHRISGHSPFLSIDRR